MTSRETLFPGGFCMNISNEEYARLAEAKSPRSPLGRDMFNAFWVGGLICVLGQALTALYARLGVPEEDVGTVVSVTLVFLGALLTGLGVYDDIARFAGAGTLVPITGFANAMVSPALEFKREGLITGSCARLFTIAGPVIVCGISASVVYGLILCLL